MTFMLWVLWRFYLIRSLFINDNSPVLNEVDAVIIEREGQSLHLHQERVVDRLMRFDVRVLILLHNALGEQNDME